MKDLLTLEELSKKDILSIISLAEKVKKNPSKYKQKLKDKNLLMIFAKPSLRTRLSFEVGMQQLGGHAIYYDLGESVLGKKESIKDGAKVMSRYVDIIMARLYAHSDMQELAKYSNVPVISGLDNYEHPCQVLGDLLTIKEKKKKLAGIKITYIGDANNNVTNSLIQSCHKLGMKLQVICPKQLSPKIKESYLLTNNPKKIEKTDVIYTDTWFSYQVPKSEYKQREKLLKPYQVNQKLMGLAGNPLFMHCLPAQRGYEVTDQVIDSRNSIVYLQAENRLHIQKAILLWCMNKH